MSRRYAYADAAVEAALSLAESWGGPYRNPRWIRDLIAAAEAEEADRRQWIEGVKRRLGIIEHGDSVTVRLAQWEQDRWHSGGIPWGYRAR